jgi:hypothetical protein
LTDLHFDTRIYALEAVEKTLLSFADKWHYTLAYDQENTNDLMIRLSTDNIIQDDLEIFYRQLAFNNIRYRVAERTATLRKLIIGRAYYHTCLLNHNDE